MALRTPLSIAGGAVLVALLALLAASRVATPMTARLADEARSAIAATGGGARAAFDTPQGWPSRHAMLTPIGALTESRRADIAQAVARVPGIGGVHWTDGTMLAEAGEIPMASLQCQDDVQAILGARTLRFEESSSALAAGGSELLNEVALALRPCVGAIIAINGHTDNSGDEPANVVLSLRRAAVVERALVARGIPEQNLRTRGMGSSVPVDGLDAGDPANRRIEFTVVAQAPLRPTPVDTPGAR